MLLAELIAVLLATSLYLVAQFMEHWREIDIPYWRKEKRWERRRER